MRDIVPDLDEQVTAPARQVLETGQALLAQTVAGETAAAPGESHSWEVDWYPIMDGDAVRAVGVNVRDVTKYARMDRRAAPRDAGAAAPREEHARQRHGAHQPGAARGGRPRSG